MASASPRIVVLALASALAALQSGPALSAGAGRDRPPAALAAAAAAPATTAATTPATNLPAHPPVLRAARRPARPAAPPPARPQLPLPSGPQAASGLSPVPEVRILVAADHDFDDGPASPPPLVPLPDGVAETALAADSFAAPAGAGGPGIGIAADWSLTDRWTFGGAIGYRDTDPAGTGAADDGAASGHQFSLRSQFAAPGNLDLAVTVHGQARLAEGGAVAGAVVDLDMRLGWRPLPGVDLSVVGRNLLQARDPEAQPGDPAAEGAAARSLRGSVEIRF